MDNVQPSDRIRRNNDGLLEQRMEQLIGEPYQSLAERLEVIGIWELLHTNTGELFFSELQTACAQLQRMAVDCESLDSDSLMTAWTRLRGMVKQGTPVEVSTEIDDSRYGIDASYNTPQQQRIHDWLSHTMELLGKALGGGAFGLQTFVVADMLPPELVAEVRAQASRDWFCSLLGIGQALWIHGRYGDNVSRSELLAVLEWAVRQSLGDLNNTSDDNDKQQIRVRLEFFWLLLKGCAYAAGTHVATQHMLSLLVKRESAIEDGKLAIDDIALSLTQGLETFKGTVLWGGNAGAASEDVDTADVIATLRKHAEEAHAQANRFYR